MSDNGVTIQRWDYFASNAGSGLAVIRKDPNGAYVLHDDHVAALDEATRQRVDAGMVFGYEAGLNAARDAVAALRDKNRQGTDPEWGVLNGAVTAIDDLIRDGEDR